MAVLLRIQPALVNHIAVYGCFLANFQFFLLNNIIDRSRDNRSRRLLI